MTWAFVQKNTAQSASGGGSPISTTLSGSTPTGNVIIVTIGFLSTVTGVTITDSAGNTYTQAGTYTQNNANTAKIGTFYATAGTTATLTVTATGAVSPFFAGMTALEYSCTPGTITVLGTNGIVMANTVAFNCGSVAFTSPVALGIGTNTTDGAATVASWLGGYTGRSDLVVITGQALGNVVADALNISTSTTNPHGTWTGAGAQGAGMAAVFQSSGDTAGMAASPTTSTNAQSVVYTLTGTGTSWTGGTTFGISGVTGASITSQSCNGGTQIGTVTVLLDNTHTGTITFTDSTDANTATTAVTLALPGAPASPVCTAGNTQNVLTWSAPASGGLTATYNVYRGTTPGGESGTPIVTGVAVLTYTDTGLTNGTTYYYYIKAVNATGTGAQSTEVSGTPSAGATFSVSPSTSTNAQSVVYTLTGSSTSWTGGTTFSISGVTGASITSQSVTGQVGTVTVLLDNTHTGTITFADTTDSATATTAVTLAVPGAPQSPSCVPGNTQTVLTWSAPITGGAVATYNVYRGTTPGGESGTPIVTGLSSPTYTNTGLTNGTTYYYYIKAVNATGTGAQSTEVSGTPNTLSMSVSPTTALVGTGNITFTVTGTGTSWTAGTIFSISGLSSASILAQSVHVSAQTATVVINPGPISGTITFRDNTDALITSATINLVVPVAPPSEGSTQFVYLINSTFYLVDYVAQVVEVFDPLSKQFINYNGSLNSFMVQYKTTARQAWIVTTINAASQPTITDYFGNSDTRISAVNSTLNL